MKKFITISIMLALFASSASLLAQPQEDQSLGLPGDNLNLYAVMKLFQESETLEGFEKNLNDENSKINNLDLDGDNYIDYIRVVDYVDRDDHTIVLQVPVNAKESQDVAAFTVQRDAGGKVYIQLVGDVALYGRDYIIEPYYDPAGESATPNPGYIGNTQQPVNQQVTIINTTPAQIAAWPLISYIYLPTYSPWRSSWYWGYYPPYWRPWRPYYYHYYYGYHYNYHNHYYGHFHRYPQYRSTHYNDFYYSSRRANSVNVNIKVQSGSYKQTYSRPESRRDGEADFVKANPSASRRTNDNSSVSRRTNDNSSVTGTSERSGQTSNSSNNRAATGTSERSGQSEKASEDKSARTTDRSSDKAAKADERKNSTNPRSFSTMERESASQRSSGQKASGSTGSRQSSTKAASSSERRSSGSSKAESAPKKSETTKAAETTKPAKRR